MEVRRQSGSRALNFFQQELSPSLSFVMLNISPHNIVKIYIYFDCVAFSHLLNFLSCTLPGAGMVSSCVCPDSARERVKASGVIMLVFHTAPFL